MNQRERKLKRENWRERQVHWWGTFLGVFYAGLALMVINETYERIITHITNL